MLGVDNLLLELLPLVLDSSFPVDAAEDILASAHSKDLSLAFVQTLEVLDGSI